MKAVASVAELIQAFIVKNPERSAQRDFTKGGKHNWDSEQRHHIAGGRGAFGTYW
jgi:hypothetical protein